MVCPSGAKTPLSCQLFLLARSKLLGCHEELSGEEVRGVHPTVLETVYRGCK